MLRRDTFTVAATASSTVLALLALLTSAALSGCATRSTQVAPAVFSTTEFATWDCARIDDELDSVQQRAADVAYAVDERSGNNIIALGVGLTVFWPAILAMRPDGLEAADLARLKGRYEALRGAAAAKTCPPAAAELPAARAASLPLALGERLVYEERGGGRGPAVESVLRLTALRRSEIEFQLDPAASAVTGAARAQAAAAARAATRDEGQAQGRADSRAGGRAQGRPLVRQPAPMSALGASALGTGAAVLPDPAPRVESTASTAATSLPASWRQDRSGNIVSAPHGALQWPQLLRGELVLGAVTGGDIAVAGDPLQRARMRGQVVAVGPQTVAGRSFDVAVVELFGDAQNGEAYTRVDGAIVVDRTSGVLLRLDLRSGNPHFALQRRLLRIDPPLPR